MKTTSVPFLDLASVHRELRNRLLAVLDAAIEEGHFVGGDAVQSFEKEFAAYCQAAHCVAVSSGTDALRFSLLAAGIKPGSMVITVPNTFIATTEAISQAGAAPAFVDIDERTYNMSPAALDEFLRNDCERHPASQTLRHRSSGRIVSAVLPVHLYGQPADMDAIAALASEFGILVFEDACQAHGSEYYSEREGRWRRAGSMGLAGSFSFYPGKNLGALGEGGAVVTSDAKLAERVRMLRDHGSVRKYYHAIEGYNGRLDAIQAGFLREKLAFLDKWNSRRRAHAARYRELLAGIPDIVAPYEPSWARQNYHLFVVQSRKRDLLQQFLSEEGIGTGLHYPLPLHLQEAYRGLNYREGDFPIAEAAAKRILSLPMFPGLTGSQLLKVAEAVRAFAGGKSSASAPAHAVAAVVG